MFNAKWIWQNCQNNTDEYVKFFQEFEIAEVQNTVLKISSDSTHAVYINGQLAATGQYPDYPHYKIYDEVDITSYIKSGKNKIVILAWYYGENFQTYVKGNAGLIFEIVQADSILTFSDNRTLCKIATDYKSIKKKITYQLGFSYQYDTNEYDFYDKDTFDLKNYEKAVQVEGISYNLFKRPCKVVKIKDDTTFGRLVNQEKQIYDLGQQTVGFLHIKFKALKNTIINISYSEHLDDGVVRRIIAERDFSVEVIANGEWFEFVNYFRRLGGRFLQVSSSNEVEIEFIGLKEAYYPVSKSEFKANSDRMQKIYDVSVKTLELCMHEHYEDTPWREQALYSMDSRNQMLCGYYAFNEFEFAKANLELMAQGQKEDKILPLCFPAGVDYPIPYFSLVYLISMEEYCRYSGDRDFTRTKLTLLNDILSFFLNKRTEMGLVPILKGYWNFYEWSDGLNGVIGQGFINDTSLARYDLVLNAFIILAMQSIEKIYQMLSMESKFSSEIEIMQKTIREKFYDREENLFTSFVGQKHFSKLCNSLAVLSGSAKGLESEICKSITESNSMTETTLSMKIFEYDALLKCNKSYKNFILNEIEKNYGYMLDKGATSFWETILGASDFDGAGSLCHGWSAIPVYYLNILKEPQNLF